MAAITVDYAVKSRNGETLRTGLTNGQANAFAFFEGLARIADLDAACDASSRGGFESSAVCQSWIEWSTLYVTPENLS